MFAGFGGQGIIKAGIITAMAACIYCNVIKTLCKYNLMDQSCGEGSVNQRL